MGQGFSSQITLAHLYIGGIMSAVKTVQVVDAKGNKIDVNEEDAANYKKVPASKPVSKQKNK